MLTPKKTIIIVLIVLTLGTAWVFYRLYKESQKLKISSVSLKPTEKISGFSDLLNIFKDGLNLEGSIDIRNFSGKEYTLNQVSLDCFTPVKEKLIAEQTNIIQHDIKIEVKKTTSIPLVYNVSVLNALKLFKECGAIPEDATIWGIITNPAAAWETFSPEKLKIKLKGFLQVQGITLNYNENYPLYE
jgi:hypothetical protein